MTIIKIFTSIKREYFKYIYLCDNSFYQSKLANYRYTKMACIWGCSSTCTIESNYVCSGGTTSSLMSGRWTFLPVTPIS